MKAKFAKQISQRYLDPEDLPSVLSQISAFASLGFTNASFRYENISNKTFREIRDGLIKLGYNVWESDTTLKGLDVEWH